MASPKPTEWVTERIAMMKARCPDLRVQGDDGTMFDPYTEDMVRFFDRFGGKRQTPNLFLDPHAGVAGIPGWDGPPTLLVPMVYGNEAVGLWGRVPAKAEPAWIAQRLAWIQPRQQPAGGFRRKGPMVAENPWLQQKEPHA